MLPSEKEQLLALFCTCNRWCQDAEARDASGAAVKYDNPDAVAWDLTGAFCRLFGGQRAQVLFKEFGQHLRRRDGCQPKCGGDSHIESMLEIQQFNDQALTTFDSIRTLVTTAPVSSDLNQFFDAFSAIGSTQDLKGV